MAEIPRLVVESAIEDIEPRPLTRAASLDTRPRRASLVTGPDSWRSQPGIVNAGDILTLDAAVLPNTGRSVWKTKRHIPYDPRADLSPAASLDIVVVYLYDGTEKDAHSSFFVQRGDLANAVLGTQPSLNGAKDGPLRPSNATGAEPKAGGLAPTKLMVPAMSQGRRLSGTYEKSPLARAVNWLTDSHMLPHFIPDCRIICIGYEINSRTKSQLDFESAADELLRELPMNRPPDLTRPLLMIGHGLGCRIIQKALEPKLTSPTSHYATILREQCIGVVLYQKPSETWNPQALDILLNRDRKNTSVRLSGKEARIVSNDALKGQVIEKPFTWLHGIMHLNLAAKPTESVGASILSDSPSSLPRNVLTMRFPGQSDEEFRSISTFILRSFQTHQLLDAAAHDRVDLVRDLIRRNANINKMKNSEGLTALHIATRSSITERRTIALLLSQGKADINQKDLKGRTALHYAVARNRPNMIIDTLLEAGAEINAVDHKSLTPLQLAQRRNSRRILKLLRKRPLVEGPSATASENKDASRKAVPHSREAEVVAKLFPLAATEMYLEQTTLTEKHLPLQFSVWEALYGKDKLQDLLEEGRREDVMQQLANHKLVCRWYHLPANNMVWVQDFLHNRFNIDAAAWAGQIRESQYPHGRCINPHASEFSIASHGTELTILAISMPYLSYEVNTRQQRTTELAKFENVRSRMLDELRQFLYEGRSGFSKIRQTAALVQEALLKEEHRKEHRRRIVLPVKDDASDAEFSGSDGDASHASSPLGTSSYQDALSQDNDATLEGEATEEPTLSQDEELLHKVFLEHHPPLHIRRTLDQYYYYMLSDTEDRDKDQVVTRWITENSDNEVHNILMVDQLWLWVIREKGLPDRVVSCFPERQGVLASDMDDPRHNVLNHRFRERQPVTTTAELVSRIVATCSDVFVWSQDAPLLQFLQYFESTVGRAGDRETRLLEAFRSHTRDLARLSPRHWQYEMRKRDILNELLDIEAETDLLREVKDILDEVHIIVTVLEAQKQVLQTTSIREYFSSVDGTSDGGPIFAEGLNVVERAHETFEKMQKQSKEVHDGLTHLLDLKQKQANVWEARSAREGAQAASRQGNVMVIFTTVTIIFLPLSFMASFFALDIAQFPSDSNGQTNWPLHQLCAWLFGMSFAVSVPFILLAFAIDFWSSMYHWLLYSGVIGVLIVFLELLTRLRITLLTEWSEHTSLNLKRRRDEYTHVHLPEARSKPHSLGNTAEIVPEDRGMIASLASHINVAWLPGKATSRVPTFSSSSTHKDAEV